MRVSNFEKFATTLTSIAKQEKNVKKLRDSTSIDSAFEELLWRGCQTYYVGRMKYANLELCKIVLSADSLDRLCLFIS